MTDILSYLTDKMSSLIDVLSSLTDKLGSLSGILSSQIDEMEGQFHKTTSLFDNLSKR